MDDDELKWLLKEGGGRRLCYTLVSVPDPKPTPARIAFSIAFGD